MEAELLEAVAVVEAGTGQVRAARSQVIGTAHPMAAGEINPLN